jgi:hypothetical protein
MKALTSIIWFLSKFRFLRIALRGRVPIVLRILGGLLWLDSRANEPSAPISPGAASNVLVLVVIVNQANPVDSISSEELRKYYLQERGQWPDGRKNTPLMLPPGSPERAFFLQKICQMSESDYKRFFLQTTYLGSGRNSPKELANGVNVQMFISNVPGSIGYIRSNSLAGSVKPVRVDNRSPEDADYPLRLPAP